MCTMYYVLCAATIERYGRQGLNIYIYIVCAPCILTGTESLASHQRPPHSNLRDFWHEIPSARRLNL